MMTYRSLLPAAALLLAACTPYYGPAPVGTSRPVVYPPSNGPGASRPASESGGSGASAPASGDQIKPAENREAPGNDAVAALLDQAWSYHDAGNYDAAIAVAERAQRLNASNPEIYLVLGSAHFAQYQVSLAEQLVRRGIAFSSAGTSIQRRLKNLLAEITAAR